MTAPLPPPRPSLLFCYLQVFTVIVRVSVFCLHVCMCAVEVRKGSDTLGLELWVVVSYHLGAENQTRVSVLCFLFNFVEFYVHECL